MAMTRSRKILLGIGLAILALGAAVTAIPALTSGSKADYSQAISIKGSAEYQNSQLLEKAWALPVAMLYRPKIEFQHNPSFCGPTSIANVSHSLHRGGDQDSVLQGSGFSTVLGFLPQGLTLDELAQIARQKVAKKVTVLRDLDIVAFREQLSHVNDPGRRYVINFSRGPLFATGGGHHSPLAAYLQDEDLVLVLDVNEKYGPWLVKPERLYEAMNTVDGASHKKRGLLLLE